MIVSRPLSLILTSVLYRLVLGRLYNQTVDDSAGSMDPGSAGPPHNITYQGNWGSQCGSICSVDNSPVNSSRAYNGTLHDATSRSPDEKQSVTIQFSGVAIYLYAIEANYIPNGITTMSNLSIQLDGVFITTHYHKPDYSLNQVSYEVPIYMNTTMPNGDHSIMVSQAASSPNDQDHSLILFDYAIYTFDDEISTSRSSPVTPANSQPTQFHPQSEISTTSSTNSPSMSPYITSSSSNNSHKFPVGPLVGALLGGQIMLVAFVIIVCRWRRRRREMQAVGIHSDAGSLVSARSTRPEVQEVSSDRAQLSDNQDQESESIDTETTLLRAPPAYSTIRRPRLL